MSDPTGPRPRSALLFREVPLAARGYERLPASDAAIAHPPRDRSSPPPPLIPPAALQSDFGSGTGSRLRLAEIGRPGAKLGADKKKLKMKKILKFCLFFVCFFLDYLLWLGARLRGGEERRSEFWELERDAKWRRC